jgi:DNA-binding MarR family transcriptional regulator
MGVHDNDDIEHQLFKLLRRTNAIHVQTSSGEVELERSAYAILCLVADDGPQRLGSIASAFRLDPSTITRQVQAVERLGLAAKSSDPDDRRAALLHLTDTGETAVERARAHRRRMLDAILADWSTAERDDFLKALTRFNDTLDAWVARDAFPH